MQSLLFLRYLELNLYWTYESEVQKCEGSTVLSLLQDATLLMLCVPGKRLNRILENLEASLLSRSLEASGIFGPAFPVLLGAPGQIVFAMGLV